MFHQKHVKVVILRRKTLVFYIDIDERVSDGMMIQKLDYEAPVTIIRAGGAEPLEMSLAAAIKFVMELEDLDRTGTMIISDNDPFFTGEKMKPINPPEMTVIYNRPDFPKG